MKLKNAQVAIEYLIVTAFLIGILVPLSYYYFSSASNASEEVMHEKSHRIGNQIIGYAKELYLTPGFAKKTLKVDIPTFVERIYSEEDKIVFDVTSSKGDSTFIFPIKTPVIVNIDPNEISDGRITLIKNPNYGSFVLINTESYSQPTITESGLCFDGFDNDWNGKIDACDILCITEEGSIADVDGDKFSPDCISSKYFDCDDGDGGINPNATEIIDGIDNNCDKIIE